LPNATSPIGVKLPELSASARRLMTVNGGFEPAFGMSRALNHIAGSCFLLADPVSDYVGGAAQDRFCLRLNGSVAPLKLPPLNAIRDLIRHPREVQQ
jgi:hypothetical protein